MAITMRKGAYADFDPSKMKAGEWAVSTDTDSNKQQVWMCFSPGVVKRMGTVEDFDTEIQILIKQYLDSMAESVEKAQESAELATSKAQESADSADKAKASEDKAKEYEESAHSTITTINEAAEATRLNKEAAAQSETNAKASEKQALSYKNSASASEQASKTNETNAKTYADNASASATSASTSASEASKSKTSASASASQAKASETNAKTSETNSAKSESEAQKYAEQAKEISESLSGALRPLGTIAFANLPTTAEATSGDMYNIADQFTTTADFKEGAGNVIPAGSNVYLTVDRYWDVLAGTPVTGVKGAKETYYRRGNVNITPANIGAVAEDGDISDTTVTFTEPSVTENIVSGEKVSVSFGKIKKWFADLKSFVFKDLVNNLTTTTTGSALDASQGKVLNDKYEKLNQSLSNLTTTTKWVTQKASTGVRYLSSDNGVQVTNEKHNSFTNIKALDFITDTASLNNLTESSYASLYSVVGISTVRYGKNCNRGIIICNSALTTKISANKWTTVATLPSGYRPCVNTPFQCHYGTILVIGQILTNGIIQVYSTSELATNSQALSINTQYII